ncbi:MAG: LysR family transcriptional regulator [Burkholderiaceae bacterium]|nr:LysR family transcriptional regulator [Burkholderiaceae bacterium]
MTRALNSSLLSCFLAVMRHGTLTAAAAQLHISQPALSKSLRRLEEELGVPLFERSAAGMSPTGYAVALAHRARTMELESERARDEIRRMKEGGAGALTIGIGPLWAMHVLPDVVATLAQRHSSLRIRVVSGVLDTLLPQLLRGDVDAVCAALDFPDHPEIEKEALIDSTHVVLAHASHPLAQARDVSAAQLAGCAFVGLHGDHAVLNRLSRFFAQRGLDHPGFATEVDSLEILLSLVQTGAFVATQSHQVLERARLLGIDRLHTRETIWRFRGGVAVRRAHVRAPAIELFRDEMRLQLARAPADGP